MGTCARCSTTAKTWRGRAAGRTLDFPMVFLTQPVSVRMKISISSFRKIPSLSACIVSVGEHTAYLGVLNSLKKGNHLHSRTVLAWIKIHSHTWKRAHTWNSPQDELSPASSTCHIMIFSKKKTKNHNYVQSTHITWYPTCKPGCTWWCLWGYRGPSKKDKRCKLFWRTNVKILSSSIKVILVAHNPSAS